MLDVVRSILPSHVTCVYIRQGEALGLGHAVLCAKQIVGDDPFAVILADDLIDGEPHALKQMVELYNYYNCSILGVENVAREETGSYGIVSASALKDSIHEVSAIVEKPRPEVAPSTLAVVGRYILSSRIFRHLETVAPGSGGEIQLTDGIASLLRQEQVLAYEFHGTRYDCGSKLGYLKATVEHALKHPEVAEEFRAWLKDFREGL